MRNDFCSNYLEHSAKGTSWRKKGAKYLSRVWKNGRWVYEYRITGKGYKRDAQNFRAKSKDNADFAKGIKKEAENSARVLGVSKSKALDKVLEPTSKGGLAPTRQRYNAVAERAAYNGRKAAEAESNYKTKSLAGIAESTVKRGQDTIKKLLSNFKTTETVTVKDTFTGKTRTVTDPKEKAFYDELEKQSKKKKK